MPPEQLESWESRDYAGEWASDDVIADFLALPRRISVALAQDAGLSPSQVVDLGAGPGAYLERFLDAFPESEGTWVDVSSAMRDLATQNLARFGERVRYLLADLDGEQLPALDAADVIVTSRVLHHFPPQSHRRLYRAAFDTLRPGGLFFNLDHVGAPGDWEPRYRRIRDRFTGARKRALKPHRHDFPLSLVGDHLEWLREAGFEEPDVPWRTFYTALFAARKPL